jgi:D-amino peptidase
MKRILYIWVLLFVAATGTTAQERKLKVYISADMEGVGGVSSDLQVLTNEREYEKFRQLMTREVNAAISGAYDAGASEVLVSDSHGDSQNIDVELLDNRVQLVRGGPRSLGMMSGIDGTFDAVVFLGYHAGEGEADAVLAHTNKSATIFEVRLNGMALPEAGFNAAIAGEFNVPVVFLSGDQTICEEARKLFGPIETAAVKQAIGFHAAIMMHPEESQRLIRAGVKHGVERRAELKAYKLAHPVHLEVTFKRTIDAEVASWFPGVQRPRGNTISYSASDAIEASRFYRAVISMNRY